MKLSRGEDEDAEDRKKVEGLSEQVVEIQTRISGPERRDTLISPGNLGLMYLNQRRMTGSRRARGACNKDSKEGFG